MRRAKKKSKVKRALDTLMLSSDDELLSNQAELYIFSWRLQGWQSDQTPPTSQEGNEEVLALPREISPGLLRRDQETNDEDILSRFPEGNLGELLLRLPDACDELNSVLGQNVSQGFPQREDPRVQAFQRAEPNSKETYQVTPRDRLNGCIAAISLAAGYRAFKQSRKGRNDSVK